MGRKLVGVDEHKQVLNEINTNKDNHNKVLKMNNKMSIYEASLTYYLYVKRKRVMLMKFNVVIVIISTIFNIVSSIIVKREVDVIKFNFKQIKNIYINFKD